MLAFDPNHTSHLVDPYDETADLNKRARSYLHANCAICHVEAGGGNGLMVLEYGAVPSRCSLFDATPQHDAFGIKTAKIISRRAPRVVNAASSSDDPRAWPDAAAGFGAGGRTRGENAPGMDRENAPESAAGFRVSAASDYGLLRGPCNSRRGRLGGRAVARVV